MKRPRRANPDRESPIRTIWRKSPSELVDRRRVWLLSSCLTERLTVMFARLKKDKVLLKPALFTISWYPSDRNCVKPGSRKVSPGQMPPLMVRKAEWRR